MISILSYALLLPFFTLPTLADSIAPVTTLNKDPSTPNGNYNWYTTPVNMTLTATDLESGVKEINYKIDTSSWQKVEYEDTLNLAPNPSFETSDSASNLNTKDWQKVLQDEQTIYSRDTSVYKSGFDITSIKVSSSGPGWHSISHPDNIAVSSSYSNMSSSVWVKTENASGSVYFKIHAVNIDGTPFEISQSSHISGTKDWTLLSSDFVVNVDNAVGVYMEIGIEGSGTVWIDAANINESITSQNTSFAIGTDGTHTLSYYSVDQAGNTESTKSTSLKVDQTPPGNWHDSGATRGLLGTSYQLWVYTTVEDATSGLSVFTDKYQYHTELNTGFGRYSNILSCSSSWNSDSWVILISPPFSPGVKSAYLLTPKTSFCNTNWNNPKIVRFYAEDMAGNKATKDFVINGPWIRSKGGGIVKADYGVDMLSEAKGDNTDGLIEAGNTQIDFFTSSKDWKIKNALPLEEYTYDKLYSMVGSKTDTSSLPSSNGLFKIDGNFTLNSSKIPSGYSSNTLSQIIFINGNLEIQTNLIINSNSTLLFIVSGDVKIKKNVTEINCGIFTDQNFYTAYDIVEGDSTEVLVLKGLFTAKEFVFQRTLQGTNNNDIPSEDFTYEPKYGLKLRDYLGKSSVRWLGDE